MLILVKQIFNQALTLEKQVLGQIDLMDLQQIRDFEPDVVVATTSQDCFKAIQLALEVNIAYALYEPDLNEIEALLMHSLKQPDYQRGKLIYLSTTQQQTVQQAGLLNDFQQQGQLLRQGSFEYAVEQLAFDSIYMGVQVI